MKAIIIFITILFPSIIIAQIWDWTLISNHVNNQNSSGSQGQAITTDRMGNVYMAGYFIDSVAIGDSIIFGFPYNELLIIKFSSSGQMVWLKHTGGQNNGNHVSGIAVDDSGNCYITGAINSTCYFDTIVVSTLGANPIFFVAKINNNGVFEWARVAERTYQYAASVGEKLAISKHNEIYVTGSFEYDFSLDGITFYHDKQADQFDIFVLKYNQAGKLMWVRLAGSTLDDFSKSITVDSSGNPYVTGKIKNNAIFGPIILHTYSSAYDGFITKLDTAGNFLWAKHFGSTQHDIGTSVSYSQFGYLYLTGVINGNSYFDSVYVQHKGGNDMFIAKYGLDGNVLFAKGFGGINNENGESIFVNELGNILVAGSFDGTAVFDSVQFISSGYRDLFAAEFDYNGNLNWIIPYSTSLIDYAHEITADKFDNVFVIGGIKGVPGFQEYDFSIFAGKIHNPTTPVELKTFWIEVNEKSAVLNWSTATELNNLGFEIEKKFQNYLWKTIGFKGGHGTTIEEHAYSFTDKSISDGKYHYRLKQIDFDGSYTYSKEIEVEILSPYKFKLAQNFPNPFNPSTRIQYQVSSNSHVSLKVYDVLGNEVATLVDEYKPAGTYEVEFLSSVDSQHLASGVYYCQLRANDFVITRKMLLLK